MSNEKIHKIIDLCLEAKKKGHDCFLRYSGHVEHLDFHVHLFGWSSGKEPDYESNVRLKCKDVDEKLEEIIVYLEDNINNNDKDVKLNNFKRIFDSIITSWRDSNIKDNELSKLLTKIELEFSIPAFKDETYNAENPDVMELYRNVSNERSFVKNLKDIR